MDIKEEKRKNAEAITGRCVHMQILHSTLWGLRRVFSPPPCKTVPKITVSLSERDHLSLKLLSIVENKNIGNILIEAVRDHIKHKGADRLKVNPGED